MLRNKCTKIIKNAKSEYYLNMINKTFIKLKYALFIDLSKAFDTVDHDLLQRLKCAGFSNTVLKWFSSYLTGRTKCVSIDNYISNPSENRCSSRINFGTNFIFCLYK